jgi:hypothetical protein
MLHAFILIFGTRPVKSEVSGGRREMRNCPACGLLSEMREHRLRNFFTLFFIPLIPLGRGQTVMTCSRCGFSCEPQREYFSSPQPSRSAPDAEFEFEEEKTVITCRYCAGKLRVPLIEGKQILVTCPHCRRKFEVKA